MAASVMFISLVVTLISVSLCNGEDTEYGIDIVGNAQVGVDVSITAQSSGRAVIHLYNEAGDRILNLSYRKNWGTDPSTGEPWQNIILLNTKIGGSFGQLQRVEDIYTTVGTVMAFEIRAQDTAFSITLNEKEIATFDYRATDNVVKKVLFLPYESDSTLVKLCAKY